MSDTLFLNTGVRVQNYKNAEDGATELWDELKAQFSWVDPEFSRAVSESYMHEFLNERVTRTCLPTSSVEPVVGRQVGTAHRLFGRDSGTSIMYVTDLWEQDKPEWMSPQSHAIGFTNSFAEFGKPSRPEMLNFFEIFFIAPDEELSGFYGFDLSDANDSTLYSALVSNNSPIAYRRYTNFAANDSEGILMNWQSLYVFFCKKARRMDLARSLFSQPFMST